MTKHSKNGYLHTNVGLFKNLARLLKKKLSYRSIKEILPIPLALLNVRIDNNDWS